MPFKILSDATGEELYALQQAGLLWWVSSDDGGTEADIITIPCEVDTVGPGSFCRYQSYSNMFGLLLED